MFFSLMLTLSVFSIVGLSGCKPPEATDTSKDDTTEQTTDESSETTPMDDSTEIPDSLE
jgi:hypothetical protein